MKRLLLFLSILLPFWPVLAQNTEKEPKTLSERIECFYPEFHAELPGGYEEMFRYFAEKTGQIDLTHKPEGLVVLALTIAQTGEIKNVVLLKSLDPELDSLALNAAKQMPAWIPAKHQNQTVSQRFKLPVRFQKSTTEQKKKAKRKN